jgi:soluble lytic murein transglycosylase-like protein
MQRSLSIALGALLALTSTTGSAQWTNPAPPAPAMQSMPSAAISPGVAVASQAVTLRAALEATRARRLEQARAMQAALTDPVARKLVDWAIVDVFGQELGAFELERQVKQLEGWPRGEGRRAALDNAGTAGLPAGPVPYTSLSRSGSSGGSGSLSGESLSQRRTRMNEAIRGGDAARAYRIIADHGFTPGGVDYAEAEAFAGWLALNKLRDPQAADRHFARLEAAVRSPVSKARAAYWRGRTAEFVGDAKKAQAFYEQGAEHTTTFYGQLAAQRAGHKQVVLSADPTPTAADRAAFETTELARALRLLSAAQERTLVRVFGLYLGETVQTRVQLAVLMDAIKGLGEQELSLLAYRRGAQRGLILHERGYPVLTPPGVFGGAEPALVLAITRQESQFDPTVRSSADARGMMQILPGTGREVAGKIGMAWSPDLLWDANANMRLGSAYLGGLVEQFGGSYVLAIAGYNAGPSRPRQWVEFCGDPRSPSTDVLDFIECIPFSETRNYVMNVMSNIQVYRARLNRGRADTTAAADLARGRPRYAGRDSAAPPTLAAGI